MAAVNAATHNPDLRTVFLRRRAAGKPHKVAVVNVMRKLVALANVLPRDRPN